MGKFSLWCDFIESSFLDNGFLELLNLNQINGATSNPSIFKQAILTSPVYKDKIAKLKGKKAKEIYEELAICDIQKAADKLAPKFYNQDDGFISLEIDPRLHDDTSLSLGEAKRLFSAIGRENVMMKIPATDASYEVMSVLMSEGVNVNATLVFSFQQCQKCFEALNEGLKKFRQKNIVLKGQIQTPKAVISIFVSRFDKLLNDRLIDRNKLGIWCANFCYNFIKEQNEPNIRALFASTGVKSDDLPKDYYIRELLFEDSINTAPLDAIRVFNNYSFNYKKALSNELLHQNLIKQNLSQEELTLSSKSLLDDGLKQFCTAFEEILNAL